MGLGYFNTTTGEIHLLVNFRFTLSPQEVNQWQGIFIQAAQRFHTATRNKLKISKISWTTSVGPVSSVGTADLLVHSQLDQKGYAYLDQFSRRGGNANLAATGFGTAGLSNTIVHELAHYILNVSDEYRTDWFQLEIDREADLDTLIQNAVFPNGPDQTPDDFKARIIPLIPGQTLPQPFSNARVRIGNDLQDRIMFFVEETYMTTNAPFTKIAPDSMDVDADGDTDELIDVNAIPQSDADPNSPVYGYESSFCTGACIMQDADFNGSLLLCEANTHASGNPVNAQHALHGESCWQTVIDTLQERYDFDLVNAPDLAYSDPLFEDLLPQRRIAVVFDRSGSMGSDGKIVTAKEAAQTWLSTYLPGEWVSLTWYNQDHMTTQDLTELSQGSAANYADQLDVDPQGSTNIRDALVEGLNQVTNGAPGTAAVNAVVLMTDGLHNTPANSDARSIIDQFKAVHTPIYAIGFGSADEVDMDLLDDLAAGTGGIAYSDAESGFLDAVTRISFELRTGLVLDFNAELGASKIEAKKRKPKSDLTKPGLVRLLADHRLIDFGLRPFGKSKKNNALSIPVNIESGSLRAIFYLRRHNIKDPSWFYLLDPEDNEIDFSTLGKAYFKGHGIEQVVIEKPKPGIWHMLVVKDDSDLSTNAYSLMAASENPRISVVVDADKQNPKGAPVRIWGMASYDEPLSDLLVTAEIFDPTGNKSSIALHESTGDIRRKGFYEGFYLPSTSGRFTGKIKFVNKGRAIRALAGSHPDPDEKSENKGGTINIKSKAPPFTRYANFYFDSGVRRQVTDNDALA